MFTAPSRGRPNQRIVAATERDIWTGPKKEAGIGSSIDLLKDYGYTTFLTMDNTPKRFIRLRGVRTEVLQSLLWAVSGYSLKLRRCTTVEPRNHAFIVAVPPLLELAAQGSVR